MVEAESETFRPEVPDYALVRVIGRGSYGEVWLARSSTGMFRAVKIVQRASFADARPYEREYEGVKRFERISIGEPSQLALLHVGRNETRGFFYYVMELADDLARGREIDPANYQPRSLRAALSAAPLPAREVVDLGVALGRALSTLHRHGLVHRDVKPSNVIFVGGVPKLADIGLIAGAQEDRTVVGTLGYMPRAGAATPAADCFALGKVLYELATGLSQQEWPRLPADPGKRADRKLFFELNAVLLRACGDGGHAGFPDAAAMLGELLLLQGGKSVLRLRFLEQRVGQALRAVAVLALIAGVAIAGAWIQFKRAEKAEAARDEERQRNNYAAILAQAKQAIDGKEFGRARSLLDGVNLLSGETRRGLEWVLLRRRAEGEAEEILRRSGPLIDRLVLSPDGERVAVKDESGRVALFGRKPWMVRGEVTGIHRLAGFSSDGSWLCGTNNAFALQRWSLVEPTRLSPEKGGEVFRPLGAQGADRIVAFADGSPPSVLVWDFSAEREVSRVVLGTSDNHWEFFRGTVNASGTVAVVACVRGRSVNATMGVFRVDLDREATVAARSDLPAISAVGFDANENAWAVESTSGAVWTTVAQKTWVRADVTWPANTSASWSTGRNGGRIHVFDGAVSVENGGKTSRRLGGHSSTISAAVQLDNAEFLTASTDGELRRWRVHGEQPARESTRYWKGNGLLPRITTNVEETVVLLPEDAESITVLTAGELKPIARIPDVRRVLWAAKNQYWAECADGTTLVAGEILGSSRRVITRRSGNRVVNFGVSPDRARATVSWSDGVLQVWDVRTGKVVREFSGRFHDCWPLELDAGGHRAWVAWADHRVSCIDLESGFESWSRTCPAVISFTCLVSKGRELAVARSDGVLEVLNANSGVVLRSIPSGSLEYLLELPNERRFVAVGQDGCAQFLEAETWTTLFGCPLDTCRYPKRLAWIAASGTLLALDTTGQLHRFECRF